MDIIDSHTLEATATKDATNPEETSQENITSIVRRKDGAGEEVGVDLCFMFDCTGSMGSYIEMARNRVKDVITRVKEAYPHAQLRVGVVAYRDIQDAKRFEILQFTSSVDEAKTFLDGLRADGGGDTPEDVNGAFQKTLFEMNWECPIKTVFHIADAPCHGRAFHGADDSHPDGYKDDMEWEKIFFELIERRLDYVFLKITNLTDLMFKKFQEIAEKQGLIESELVFEQEVVYASTTATYTPEVVHSMKIRPEAAEAVELMSGKSEKMKFLCEEHFTEAITEKVKSRLAKPLKKK